MSTIERNNTSVVSIRTMRVSDYRQAFHLWRNSKGIGVWGDTRPRLVRYLKRNPGFSLVAVSGGQVVGTVLGGHDGRRGFIFHLAVAEAFQQHGLGRRLATLCLQKLEKAGVLRTHIMVFRDNPQSIRFWKKIGWVQRSDLLLFSSAPQKKRKRPRS